MLATVINGVSRQPAIEGVMNWVLTKGGVGSRYTYADMERAMGPEAGAKHIGKGAEMSRFRGIMESARKRLLVEHQVHLRTERMVGYRWCDGPEQMTQGFSRMEQGVKCLRKGRDIVQHLDDAQLTSTQRQVRANVLTWTKTNSDVLLAKIRADQLEAAVVPKALPPAPSPRYRPQQP